jgi:hypothetical protein
MRHYFFSPRNGRSPLGLWLNAGDGVNQVADFFSDATSIPSRKYTRLTTFGN